MELLVKYRNDKKKEGASPGELRGIDGRINALFSSSSQNHTLDMEIINELLVYRNQLKLEGARHDLLSRVDTLIYHTIGTNPSRIVDLSICTLGDYLNEVPVSVDLNNETVRDLAIKASAALGFSGPDHIRLISSGKHMEPLDTPLSSFHFKSGTKIFICGKLGCNGRCCEQHYNSLYDAYLRDVYALFKDTSPEALHTMMMIVSNEKAKNNDTSKAKKQTFAPDSAFKCVISTPLQRMLDVTDDRVRAHYISPFESNLPNLHLNIKQEEITPTRQSPLVPIAEEDLYG